MARDDMGEGGDRFAQASAWFSRMRGPDAEKFRGAFAAWLDQSGNADAYREMEAIWGASAQASTLVARRRPAYLRPGLIAAGVATALTIGFLVVYGGRGSDTSGFASFASDRGQIRVVELADGSRVTLDSDSAVRVDLTSTERRVTLVSGRARFSVAHDAEHPFVVVVGEDAVVARGTIFDVRLVSGQAEVALYEGAVDLERRESRAPPRVIGRLRPGQKARFAANDAEPKIAAAGIDPWPAGIRPGQSMRLADVVAEANRYGATQIVLAEPAIGDLRLSGGFRPADTRDLAHALAAAFDLSIAEGQAGSITLSRHLSAPTHAPGSEPLSLRARCTKSLPDCRLTASG
ncbi:FecR domain-containing protein [Novosphingobium sp. PS1R-30]|uniref:FecR domain-containing protein n=1 Tax=Novosphingobium anseongense TaxID=3133436 RepID=A0ABU8S1H0_9SPHN